MMHEPDCRGDAAPAPPDISTAHEQSGARALMAGTLSARLLPAHDEQDHVAVLSVHGEIDLGTASMLRDVLMPVLEHQTGPVVIDLSTVSFMDSSGVHLLVETLRRLERQNRALALVCHEDGQVHELLALVGLLDVVTVCHPRTRNAPRGPGADLMPAIH
jgi:anti-anti-sigma factor